MNNQSVVPGVSFYFALKSYYNSQKHEALGVLKLYITNPLAVSDHSNFLEDMKEATRKLAEADEALKTLNNYFVIQDPSSQNMETIPE
tara:strand:+ start:532 stop:795 length:264 start_codon:yes stop_codon:yes gene_type:complete